MSTKKLKLATASLAGCFGCHMSLMDLDERLLPLLEWVEFDRSPITDIKQLAHCDIGILEGGVCNTENLEVLHLFRERCDILVAMGACAITGGVPAMRNNFSVKECLQEAYIDGMGIAQTDKQIPNDKEIPSLLEKVQPLQEIVKIDYFLPGCPPSADAIWHFLTALHNGEDIHLPYPALHYD